MEEVRFTPTPNPRKSRRELPRAGGWVFQAEKRACKEAVPATSQTQGDGQRQERRIIYTEKASHHVTQLICLCLYTLSHQPGIPPFYSLLCHLQSPSSRKHSLTLQGRGKVQELIPPKPQSHSTQYVPLSDCLPRGTELLRSRAYRQGSCPISVFVSQQSFMEPSTSRYAINDQGMSGQTKRKMDKLNEGRRANNTNSLLHYWVLEI